MIVGTAGHIDHGKTALVRALTGTDTDRLKEERARGITIDLGFAYMPAAAGVIGFVDVPGHQRLVRTMLAGASGIDLLLLVVAADDGVMPQTREHLAIVELLGITEAVVALTKADLADPARIAAVEAEVGALLSGTALAGAEVVPVSALTGLGMDDLRARIEAAAAKSRPRPGDRPFRLAVDRSFAIRGAGTVVTGTVLSGAVRPGDELVVSPRGLPVRVRGLHAQNRESDEGRAGERCALNLAGIHHEAIARGDMVLAPELHAPAGRIDARLRVLASERRPVSQWMPVHLHHAAAEVPARVVLLSDPVGPGEEALVQLVPDRPIPAASGDRFVIRDTSALRTVGGGVLIDLRAPARRRRTPERLARIAAQEGRDDARVLAALLDLPPGHLDPDAFARDRAISRTRMDRLLAQSGAVVIEAGRARLAIAPGRVEALMRRAEEVLAAFHAANPHFVGMGLERLRASCDPLLLAPAFRHLLAAPAMAGRVVIDGAWVRLAGHEVRLDPGDEVLWQRIRPALSGEARFRPPRVRDFAGDLDLPEAEVRELFHTLARMGRVHEMGRDRFFLSDTVGEMVDIVFALQEEGPSFTAAAFRDRVDNGRKVAIEILEFLDRHGVTIRRGDLRRANPRRRHLFPREGAAGEISVSGGESSPVGRPDFKSGRGRETVSGGFDSHSLPPMIREASS